MPYRVVMEVVPRPDDTPAWIWNETNVNSVSSNGGKGWTAKLDSSDSIWEYDNQSDANAKMSELDSADSTNRRYKVIEV
tara:strand:- start:306 stop:542 length:237 start_codon:yes stop_codon:yes gene_type:complete